MEQLIKLLRRVAVIDDDVVSGPHVEIIHYTALARVYGVKHITFGIVEIVLYVWPFGRVDHFHFVPLNCPP